MDRNNGFKEVLKTFLKKGSLRVFWLTLVFEAPGNKTKITRLGLYFTTIWKIKEKKFKEVIENIKIRCS